MHEVAREAVLMQYPEYQDTHNDIFVRTEALVEENIRDLRFATVQRNMLAKLKLFACAVYVRCIYHQQ